MRLTPPLRTPGLLFASAVTLCAAGAYAQEPTAPPPAAPAPAAPAPAAPATAAPAPAETAPAAAPVDATAAPAAAPPAAEEVFPAAWTRLDMDFLGLQLWAGATHPLSDTVGIATDIYLNAPLGAGMYSYGEFDLGPAFTAGKFIITPMLGIQFDIWNHRAQSLVPQLFLTGGGGDPIYMELWVQNYENQVFDKAHATNNLYIRYFLDFTLSKYLAVGPEVEALIGINAAGKKPNAYAPDLGHVNSKGEAQTLVSLPVGLNIALTNYGKNNTLMIFGGYETQKTPTDNRLAGRLTFIHNF